MRPIGTLILALLFSSLSIAQESQQGKEKAGRILERLSEKHRQHETVRAKFNSRMVSKKDDLEQEREGSLKMKGDKFVLDLGEQKVFSDGETRWIFLEDDNEVQIKKESKGDEEETQVVHPTDLFTIWEKGFKYRYTKRIREEGRSYHVIELHPEDPSDKPYHTIQLKIDKEKEAIREVRVFGKQGTDYIYELGEMENGVELDDSEFEFDPSEHPGIEKVDLR